MKIHPFFKQPLYNGTLFTVIFLSLFAASSAASGSIFAHRVVLSLWASDIQEKQILGTWISSDGNGKIQIYKKGNLFFGKIVFVKFENLKGAQVLDVKNPIQNKRKNKVLGMEILKDFTYSGSGLWEHGTIYDPKTGKLYSCKISMVSPNEIKLRGFIGISLFGRTEIWKRSQ